MKEEKGYGIFVCPICNELGQVTRASLVPNITNKKEKVSVHKSCEKTAYKQLYDNEKVK